MADKTLTREQVLLLCAPLQENFGPVVDHEWELRVLVTELAEDLERQALRHPHTQRVSTHTEKLLAQAKAVST